MKTTAAYQSTPPAAKGARRVSEPSGAGRRNFLVFAANMSWQLLIVVLLPIIGGAQLDKRAGGRHLWVFVGLAVAFVASTLVMWRTVQLASRLPVPKLSAAEKREIQKRYEEEDADE